MAGLDSIKHFEGGGETGEEATVAAPLTAKSVAAKGPYALPTPTGNVGVPQSLLENMQKLITEREMQKDSFMERMKDANAWWSGGKAGPGEALRARETEREGQAATTFGMKSQLAQHKAAQEREANLATQLFGTPPTKATTGAGVAPTTATGVAPTATGVGAAPTGRLIDLVLDPGLKQSIMVTGQSQGNEAAQKQIHAYLAENAKNPEFIKTINILVRQGLIDPSLVASIGLTHLVGSGSFTPQKINTPGGVVQTTPFDIAKNIVGATPPPATIAPPMTSKTLMSPQDLASQIQKDFKIDLGSAALERDAKMQGNLVDRAAKKEQGIYMPDPVIAGKDKYHVGAIDVPLTVPESYLNARGYYRPLGAKDPVHAVPIPQQDNTQGASNVKIAGVLPHVQPIAKISNVSQTSTGFTPGSDQDLAIRQKRAEIPIEAGAEFGKKVEVANAAKANLIDTSALSAPERKSRFNDIIQVTSDPSMQEVFGKLAKKGIVPFTLKQLESGISAGQFGTMGIGNLERNLMEAGATQDQILKLHRVEKHLAAAELEYAKTYLTGQGAVSDNERKLVKDAVGSVKDPAKVLRMQASIMAERAEFDEKIGGLYDKYRDTHGDYASFGQFIRSKEARSIINDHNTKLADLIGKNPSQLNDPYKDKGSHTPGKIKWNVEK